jgi:hypothetical protein
MCSNLYVNISVTGLHGLEAIHHTASGNPLAVVRSRAVAGIRDTYSSIVTLRVGDLTQQESYCPYSCTASRSEDPYISILLLSIFCLLAYFCSTNEIYRYYANVLQSCSEQRSNLHS